MSRLKKTRTSLARVSLGWLCPPRRRIGAADRKMRSVASGPMRSPLSEPPNETKSFPTPNRSSIRIGPQMNRRCIGIRVAGSTIRWSPWPSCIVQNRTVSGS